MSCPEEKKPAVAIGNDLVRNLDSASANVSTTRNHENGQICSPGNINITETNEEKMDETSISPCMDDRTEGMAPWHNPNSIPDIEFPTPILSTQIPVDFEVHIPDEDEKDLKESKAKGRNKNSYSCALNEQIVSIHGPEIKNSFEFLPSYQPTSVPPEYRDLDHNQIQASEDHQNTEDPSQIEDATVSDHTNLCNQNNTVSAIDINQSTVRPGAVRVGGTNEESNRSLDTSVNNFQDDADQEMFSIPINGIVPANNDGIIEDLENERNELAGQLNRYEQMPVIFAEKTQTRNLNLWGLVAFTVLAIIAVVTSIVVTRKNIDDKTPITKSKSLCPSELPSNSLTLYPSFTTLPTAAPSVSLGPSASPTLEQQQFLVPILSLVSDKEDLLDESNPRNEALRWVAEESTPESSRNDILQGYILSLLYFSTEGENWNKQYSFLKSLDVCQWNEEYSSASGFLGVKCIDGNVTDIHLISNALSGTIPSEIASIGKLQSLELRRNALRGTIPSELGVLANLLTLNIDDNDLNDTIPSELGRLKNLQILDLGDNDLNGKIPSEIGNLKKVEKLYFNRNALTGTIPSELGSLESLEYLSFSINYLTGTIPSEFTRIKNLIALVLYSNQLTGTIPLDFVTIDQMFLHKNNLTGAINFLCENKEIYLTADCFEFTPPGSEDCCKNVG